MRCNRDITFDWIELETYSAITPAQARPNHASLQQLGRDRTSGWSLIFSSPSCSGRHQALHRQDEVSSGESQGVLCANSINLSCFLDFLRLGAGSFRQPTYLPRFVGKLLKIHRKFLTDSVKSLQNISKYVNGKSCLLQIVPPQLPTPRNTLIRFDFQRFFGIWPGFPTIPANIHDLFTEKWWFQISPFFIGSIPTPWLVTWMSMSSLPTIAVLTRSSHARGTSIPLTSLHVGALRGTSPLLCGSLFSSLYSPKTSQHKCYPFTPNMFID